jgi:pimeloyl-ACP methyl ester carboxylesterase
MRALLVAVVLLLTPIAVLAQSRELKTLEVAPGVSMRYALLLPPGMEPRNSYPVLCVLPSGNQNAWMIEAALLYFEEQARTRGWVVLCPAAGDNSTLADVPADHIDRFIDGATLGISVEGGKVHLAGIASGGRAAFAWALNRPARFASLTALPGYLPEGANAAALKDIPVALYVGDRDTKWVDESRRTASALSEAGARVALHVLPGQDHVVTIDRTELFDHMDAERLRAPTTTPDLGPEVAAINAVLNDFHLAAAQADQARYFAHLTADSVFIGTDITERWNKDQFLAFASPYFAKGKAWTYTPRSRNVTLSPRADVAWFDEVTNNPKYGDCRGTGVMIKVGDTWRIAQYNLSMPIPNSISGKVVDLIRKDEMNRPK